jgi:hypothetical protein
MATLALVFTRESDEFMENALTTHLGGINLPFALIAAALSVLVLGWSVSALAQQATRPSSSPTPPARSATASVPSTPTQTPDSSTNQTQTPTPGVTKPRRLMMPPERLNEVIMKIAHAALSLLVVILLPWYADWV